LSGSNPAYNDFVAAAGKPFGFEELSRFVGTTRKAKSGNKKTTLLVGAANIRGGSKILGQDFTQAAYSALLQDVIRFN
jgi:hypothetical protein